MRNYFENNTINTSGISIKPTEFALGLYNTVYRNSFLFSRGEFL